jgi:hypothetical protein
MDIRIAAAFAVASALATIAACASPGGPQRLSDQQVCLEHHKGDAAPRPKAGRRTCRSAPTARAAEVARHVSARTRIRRRRPLA